VFPSLKDWVMNMDDEERLRVALVLDVDARNQRKETRGISPSPNERFTARLIEIALNGRMSQ